MFDILVNFRRLRKMLTGYLPLIWNRPGQRQNKINHQNFPVEQVLWKNIGHHIALLEKKTKTKPKKLQFYSATNR